MWLEISLSIAAIAWVILVIYLVIVLIQCKKFLNSINTVIPSVTNETVKLLKTSTYLTENVLDKAEKIDPLFESISDVSQSAQNMIHSYTKRNKELNDVSFYKEKEGSDLKINEWMELAALGIILWQKLKKRS